MVNSFDQSFFIHHRASKAVYKNVCISKMLLWIVGFIARRRCDQRGYWTHPFFLYNSILPSCAVTSRDLMVEYADTFGESIYHDILSQTKGNGEDLCYNHFLIKRRLRPEFTVGYMRNLDEKTGSYQHTSDHYKVRNEICHRLYAS